MNANREPPRVLVFKARFLTTVNTNSLNTERSMVKTVLTLTIDIAFLCKPIWWNATVSPFSLVLSPEIIWENCMGYSPYKSVFTTRRARRLAALDVRPTMS